MTGMVRTTEMRSNGRVKLPHQGPESAGCLANPNANAKARADPMAAGVMAELKTANSCRRRGIVGKAGLASPPLCASPRRQSRRTR